MNYELALLEEAPALHTKVKDIIPHLQDPRKQLRQRFKEEDSWSGWKEVYTECRAMKVAIESGDRKEWIGLVQSSLLPLLGLDISVLPLSHGSESKHVTYAKEIGFAFPILSFVSLRCGPRRLTQALIWAQALEPFELSASLPKQLQAKLKVPHKMLLSISRSVILQAIDLSRYSLSYSQLLPAVAKLTLPNSQERLSVVCTLIRHIDTTVSDRKEGEKVSLGYMRRIPRSVSGKEPDTISRLRLMHYIFFSIHMYSSLEVTDELRSLTQSGYSRTDPEKECVGACGVKCHEDKVDELAICMAAGIERDWKKCLASIYSINLVQMAFIVPDKTMSVLVAEVYGRETITCSMMRVMHQKAFDRAKEINFRWDIRTVLKSVESLKTLEWLLPRFDEDQLNEFRAMAAQTTHNHAMLRDPAAYVEFMGRHGIQITQSYGEMVGWILDDSD